MRRLGLTFAAALACTGLTACGKPSGETAAPAPVAEPAAVKEPTAAEKQTLLAALPTPYNTGDLENGKRQFAVCKSCHTITPGGANMTGPNLYGVFGAKAGTHPDYNYSDAVKAAGFTWDADHLDKWLTNPRTFLPGTKMTFPGIKAEKDRVDLIAYLKVETGYKP